ncbi:hypothetical protein [Patulibacter sp.]|uniref:hypothetical protein n=1 Tax=Patulibacter sp. TaxID=1912859 RepID=UPI002719F773|nr:hypothetical protein [Patulibacter sp.]MDO9410289.1 hypothetical protein [Patulibacter sp.]
MRSSSRTAVLAVTFGVAMVPAAASAAGPAATTFTGWDAPGPLGVGTPSHVSAAGTTTVILGTDLKDGRVPIAVTSATGSRVGRVEVNSGDAGPLAVAAAGADRLLLADTCRVRHSEDRGLAWKGEPLAGCSGAALSLTVASADVAFASTDKRTWRTVDGGATWTVANAGERGPQLALDQNVGLRTVAAGAAGLGLQRSVDGGASWQGVKVPGPPTDSDAAPLVDALPSIAGLARRADGAVVVGAGNAVLVSTDQGATFTRRVVPIPDDLPGATGVLVKNVVCGTAGGCVVGVTAVGDPARQSALRFDGDAFGARVAALPDAEVTAPAADAVVGITRPQNAGPRVLRSDDAGATAYRPLASGDDRTGSLGVHGLLAIASVGRLHVSSDQGKTWNDVALPATPNLTRVASAGGKLVALADDGTLRRLDDGVWATLADVSAIRPAALAVAGDTPVVVGARGVIRLTDPAKPAPVESSVLQGRGFTNAVAQGSTVLAWARRGSSLLVVRSTDGGRTWKQSKLPKSTDDVQLVSAKTAYALDGRTLYRSTDGAKTFKRRAIVPNLGAAGPDTRGAGDPSLEFSSDRDGVLITPAGAFVTRDGASTLRVLPTPGATTPPVAAVFGSGVVLQDSVLGAVFRNTSLLGSKAPTLTLRTAGKAKKGKKGVRTATVVGVLKGAADDEPVSLVAWRGGGRDTSVLRSVTPNADGSFRVTVRLTKTQKGVQAWYRGAVLAERTDLSTVSKVLRVR